MNFPIICAIGLLASFLLLALLMPLYIRILKNHKINQEVSEYALEEYKQKSKTPIMGGLLFVLLPLLVYLAIQHTFDRKTLLVILSFVLFCLVGFLDDILIILRHDNNGLSPKVKLIMEFIFTGALCFFFRDVIYTGITIPFTNIGIDIRWFYYPFMILLYLAEANAVNFTDGMDGLCAGVSVFGLIAFIILACAFKEYHIALLLFCIVGGLFGYLIYNHFPAKIFMGDSGSLALGGLFASLGVVLKSEIALFVIGGVFVWEMFCVVLQLSCVKLFHKRIFKYTPIHYAFVLGGMKETAVVRMFYIIALILAVLGTFIGLHA